MFHFQNLLLSLEEGILIVTINREDKLNALNSATIQELKIAFQKAYDDETVRGVILTGAGEKAFVAGADISEISQLADNSRKFSEEGQEVFAMIENLHKPVIACVNGFALGGGCEIAMACHIRIATEKARFALPEVKLGLLPGYGGTQRLPQLVGKAKALELMLTADMITASEAKELGLVNHVVADIAELHKKAKDILYKIFKNSPSSIALIINVVNISFQNEIGYQAEANAFLRAIQTEDFIEGTSAFLQKREPNFTGK
jgi:enoyl-CoA hydratase